MLSSKSYQYQMDPQQPIIFKASGKVMIAGGYGVLEQQNLALTLAIDKHFYARTTLIKNNQSHINIAIEVSSPQLKSQWNYLYQIQSKHIQEVSHKCNPFVQNAIRYTLAYCISPAQSNQISKIKIDILFDRGFLSQQQSLSPEIKFINYQKNATKTGLGSSACVTVAIVGVLLKQLTLSTDQRVINCLSHVANLAAQLKIGSNFDISTAVFGSHLYKNVLPRRAFQVINSFSFQNVLKIDPEIQKLTKINLSLVQGQCWLLDLKIGSNTRTMVSGFLKKLNQHGSQTVQQFNENSKIFVQKIFNIFTQNGEMKEVVPKLKQINSQYRAFLQKFSKITGIPVQPPQFKLFLDQICELQEVAYAICPGSGGYDAIFILSTIPKQQDSSQLKEAINSLCLKHGLQNQLTAVNIQWQKKQFQDEQLKQIIKYLS